MDFKVKLSYSEKDKLFTVLESFTVLGIKVPEGFTSDLDTVYRVPIFYQWLKGRTVIATIIHDYLYSIKYDRKEADKIFLKIMKITDVRKRYRYPIYWAVRLFGWIRY